MYSRLDAIRGARAAEGATNLVSGLGVSALLGDPVLGDGLSNVSTGVSGRVVGMRALSARMLEEAQDGVVRGGLNQLLRVNVLAERHVVLGIAGMDVIRSCNVWMLLPTRRLETERVAVWGENSASGRGRRGEPFAFLVR